MSRSPLPRHESASHRHVHRLTRTSLLARNSLWNLAGQLGPVILGLIAVPALVHGLGVERFGVLTMVWMVIGYFSLFDFGLGWALTHVIASRMATDHQPAPAELVWTAITAMTLFGAVGGLVLGGAAWPLATSVFHVSPELRHEVAASLEVIALALPAVTGTAALTGVLGAYQRFDLVNLVRLPLGLLNFLGPLAVLPFTHDLAVVAATLVVQRLLAAFCFLALVLRIAPQLRPRFRLDWSLVRPLLAFGQWMAITNVVGPVMIYLDRFIIAALLSAGVVAYYTTPFDLVTRLWILSTPVTGVLFPAFAATFAADRARTRRLFENGLLVVLAALLPGALLLAALAPEGLRLWLGTEFAVRGAPILRLLSVGVLVNGVAQVALALVQAAGRPDLGAKLHLVELPLYLALLGLLIHRFGLVGAAIAWVVRVALDAAVLLVMAARLTGVPASRRAWGAAGLAAAALVVAAGAAPVPLWGRAAYVALVLMVGAYEGWRRGLPALASGWWRDRRAVTEQP